MSIRSICGALCLTAIAVVSLPAQAAEVYFSQRPDMVAGTDTLSMHRSFGPVVADDFKIWKSEIVGFRWWGSYFMGAGQSRTNPRAMQFELSFHSDCPAGAPISAQCPGDPRSAGGPTPYGYSTPGQPYSFQILNAQETFYGTTAAGEDVYEYFVMLQQPWRVNKDEIYWFDVAWDAVQAAQFGLNADDAIWGWHESFQHSLDSAVQTDRAANSQDPQLGGNPHLGPWNVLQGKDMAFEVIAVPEPLSLLLVAIGLLGVGATRRTPGR